MPEVSRFYGIVVTVSYNDRAPPHLHARYGDLAAVVRFDGVILAGALPARALALVRQWAAQHQADLADDLERAHRQEPLRPIAPLD